jgi:hypothetical protein
VKAGSGSVSTTFFFAPLELVGAFEPLKKTFLHQLREF